MKKIRKFLTTCIIVTLCVVMVSCGNTQFNTIGSSFGNFVNGAEVTSQNNETYYIEGGNIYKTSDTGEKGKLILEGDVSNLNIVGEKIYYYDNSISTICKANSEGNKIERIAEIYCEKFVVNKDNIFASVLTGQGGESLEDPDNYNISSMKVTDRKVTNTKANVVVEKARFVGTEGDRLFFLKNTDKGIYLCASDLTGGNITEIMEIPEDGRVIVDGSNIFMMGTVDKEYGLYLYNDAGELKEKLVELDKNPKTKHNAFLVDGDTIYYEVYKKYKDDGETITKDYIKKITLDNTEKPETVLKNSKVMEYYLSKAADGVMIKARKAGDIKTVAVWEVLEKSQ